MATTRKQDMYAQRAVLSVTQSVANTLTFEQLNLRLGLSQRRTAWIIHRIEWTFAKAAMEEMTASGDLMTIALTTSNQLTTLLLTQQEVITSRELLRLDYGTAGSAEILDRPEISDFMLMPGGGLIVIPNRLYIGLTTTGLASAATAYANIYYTERELRGDDFLELLEASQTQS